MDLLDSLQLNDKEQVAVNILMAGGAKGEIAKALNITNATVSWHIKNLKKKFILAGSIHDIHKVLAYYKSPSLQPYCNKKRNSLLDFSKRKFLFMLFYDIQNLSTFQLHVSSYQLTNLLQYTFFLLAI